MAFEKYILPSIDEPKMEIHLFRAFMGEYIESQKTKNDILAAIEGHLDVSLTDDEKSDLQALMTAIDGETTPEEKRSVADDTYRVLIIAESDEPMYSTKALLKARLSWI